MSDFRPKFSLTSLLLIALFFNLAVIFGLYFFSESWALGYAIGSFAMLLNLLALAKRGVVAAVSFMALVWLTYWVTYAVPEGLFAYALGLASPAYYGYVHAYEYLRKSV